MSRKFIMSRYFILILWVCYLLAPSEAMGQKKKRVKKKPVAAVPYMSFNKNALSAVTEPPKDTVKPGKPKPRPDSIISWRSDMSLSWDYFMGKPPAKPEHPALMHSMLSYTCKGGGNNMNVDVRSEMNLSKSWRKPKTELPVSLLIHEKVHFNICELHARKLRKEISDKRDGAGLSCDDVKNLYMRINAELIAMQELYERETVHGTNEGKQQEWNMKISMELTALGLYASRQ